MFMPVVLSWIWSKPVSLASLTTSTMLGCMVGSPPVIWMALAAIGFWLLRFTNIFLISARLGSYIGSPSLA